MPEAENAPGALKGRNGPDAQPNAAIIDNQTNLPDRVVQEAVMAHWVENAALQLGTPSSFQMYATNQGSNMMSRSPFRTPSNVIDEIKLARQVADTDDDVLAAIGQAIAIAFGSGMENQHTDEKTLGLFNAVCGPTSQGGMNLDAVLKEIYREYLIAGQFNTLSLFTRSRMSFRPSSGDEIRAQLSTPLVGIIPAENIRVVSTDIFGTGDLAYEVTDQALKDWLEEFFSSQTSPAKRESMRRDNPVIAAIFTGRVEVPWNDQDMFSSGKTLYTLNPRMVHRTTLPKGATAYPRPPLTANFALLEAKRLLNIMDYSLLQGGTNYIVVAKQGSDNLPAQQPEIDNLTDQVRLASRTGVLVGDHRITIDIITPDLKELLNPSKRKLIGRKLAMAMLRIPEQVTDDPGSEGAKQELEFTARTITSDRLDIRRHIEGHIYAEVVKRNAGTFTKGAASLWFPKIILSGIKDFYDSLVKARDRGDIPRKWAVEILGYDYEAGVAQRKREKENGDDEVLTPGAVPFSPQDGNPPSDTPPGRPRGSSSSNGRPGAPPPVDPAQRQRLPAGVQSEQVRAHWDGERTVRVGELTAAVLEEYPDHTVGRVTSTERTAVESGEIFQHGPVAIVPVNTEYRVGEIRAFRLDEGLSMIVGERVDDGAIVARALCFREPQFEVSRAVEMAMRWGFVTSVDVPARPRCPHCDHFVNEMAVSCPACGGEVTPTQQAHSQHPILDMVQGVLNDPTKLTAVQGFAKEVVGALLPNITIQMPGEGPKEIIRDDETGAIIGTRPIPPVPGE